MVWAAMFGGTSNAQISVTPGGSPNYGQTIDVPPGVAGLKPNLSLFYGGGGVNGPVGLGWTVQGISTITRCPSTRSVDGVAGTVKFNSSDKLCLDGQRLIQTNASGVQAAFPQANDAAGLASGYREFRTENDIYSRVRAYGVAGGIAANGPKYFRVWTKSGQVFEYGTVDGAGSNATATMLAEGKGTVAVWAVARIKDIAANYIDFKYEQRQVAWGSRISASSWLGNEWNIAEIQYTGTANSVPSNKVVFTYLDRTQDRSEAYHVGSKNVSARLLNKVDTYVNSPNPTELGPASTAVKVKSLQLAYDNSPVTRRSRLVSITECAGTPVKCLSPTRFGYSNAGSDEFDLNTTFMAGSLPTTGLYEADGSRGVEPVDFDGDGRTDLLRWTSPPNNRLYRSLGDGAFSEVPAGSSAGQFNLKDETIFSSGGCAASLFVDVDGDGLTDIFKVVSQGADGLNCSAAPPVYFRNKGNGGQFETMAVSAPTLRKSRATTTPGCPPDQEPCPPIVTRGETFYILDVDGDGRPDIVKTISPESGKTCSATFLCTWVYKGNGFGTFTLMSTPQVAVVSLYRWPDEIGGNRALAQMRYVADVDGDGHQDLVLGSDTANGITAWRSLGTGDFEPYTSPTDADTCRNRIDFNGDGRTECLWASDSVTDSRLMLSTGDELTKAKNFNLAVSGGPGLRGNDKGVSIVDFNSDGRGDILRWHDTPSQTYLYTSNGDGTFTQSTSFRMGAPGEYPRLITSGGSYTFLSGDFTGRGSLDILRLKSGPSANGNSEDKNLLFSRADPTPPDALLWAISPTGLKTTLTYTALSSLVANPAGAALSDRRYYNDREAGQPAAYPVVDATLSQPVVITKASETGVGSALVLTEYAYRGLKIGLDGRGFMGFRQTVQQDRAPNGEALSVWTDYLLDKPYAGVARRTETRRGLWTQPSASVLASTSNVYCEASASQGARDLASEVSPCPLGAGQRLARPFLYRSVEEAVDAAGYALPKVTTTTVHNLNGDATWLETVTEAYLAGEQRQYKKTTENQFCLPDTTMSNGQACPNKISGDNWILGRLVEAKVTATAPSLITVLSTSPGTLPTAQNVVGTVPPGQFVPLDPAVLAVIVQFLLED